MTSKILSYLDQHPLIWLGVLAVIVACAGSPT